MFSAQAVLAQLGGQRFVAMTGAKQFVAGENFLQFSLPKNFASNGINKVKVILTPMDTYTVEFWKIQGVKCTLISSHEDIYADMLQELFKTETGLDTHL